MESGLTKFEKLEKAKKMRIINAAMEIFARFDYHHASTELIARKARISKSLLFFYFGTKRGLYTYIFDYMRSVMITEVMDEKLPHIEDFFDLLAYAAERKMKVLERNPYIMDLAVQAFYSQGLSGEMKDDMDATLQQDVTSLPDQYFHSVKWDRFRDDVDPHRVLTMLVWMTDGYMHERQRQGLPIDVKDVMKEFNAWCTTFRATMYKEEYR